MINPSPLLISGATFTVNQWILVLVVFGVWYMVLVFVKDLDTVCDVLSPPLWSSAPPWLFHLLVVNLPFRLYNSGCDLFCPCQCVVSTFASVPVPPMYPVFFFVGFCIYASALILDVTVSFSLDPGLPQIFMSICGFCICTLIPNTCFLLFLALSIALLNEQSH